MSLLVGHGPAIAVHRKGQDTSEVQDGSLVSAMRRHHHFQDKHGCSCTVLPNGLHADILISHVAYDHSTTLSIYIYNIILYLHLAQ